MRLCLKRLCLKLQCIMLFTVFENCVADLAALEHLGPELLAGTNNLGVHAVAAARESGACILAATSCTAVAGCLNAVPCTSMR